MSNPARSLDTLLVPLLWASFLALSVPRLRLGLGFDEALTVYVTSGTFDDVIARAIKYQGQSPLFFVLVSWLRSLLGSSEFALRLIPFVSGCVCIVLLKELYHSLVPAAHHEETSQSHVWPLLIIMIAFLTEGEYIMFRCRPYAFALVCFLFSLRAFKDWTETHSIAALLGHLSWWVVLVFANLTFLSAGLVFFLLYLFSPRKLSASLIWIGSFFLSSALCLYLLTQSQSVLDRRELWSYLRMPGISDLIMPPQALPFLIVLLVLQFQSLTGPSRVKRALFENRLLIAWTFVPAVFCFTVSYITGASIYSEKYMLPALPGLVLLICSLLAHLKSQSLKIFALVLIAALNLYKHGFNSWADNSWREACHRTAEIYNANSDLIAVYPGLVEALHNDFVDDKNNWEYLVSSARYYLPDVPLYPLHWTEPKLTAEASGTKRLIVISDRWRKFSSQQGDVSPAEIIKDAFTRWATLTETAREHHEAVTLQLFERTGR